jgi:hypothetical protein
MRHREIILNALPPGGQMMEWGSGDSTGWFRKNMADNEMLASIEHHREWAAKTGAIHVPYEPGANATEAEEDRNLGWEVYVKLLNIQAFDVILVDGVLRNACLEHASRYMHPGSTIFLHDAQRPWYDEGKSHFRNTKTHKAERDYPGPTLWEAKC